MLTKTSSLSIGFGGSTSSSRKRQLTLIGRSRAGEGTSFALPELGWIVDCGARIVGWKPAAIFITHCHSDHVHDLTSVCGIGELLQQEGRTLTNTKGQEDGTLRQPTIPLFVPAEATCLIQNYLNAYQVLIECNIDASTASNDIHSSSSSSTTIPGYSLRPTSPGDEIIVQQKTGTFLVRAIKCDHRIVCLGYSIFERKHMLKPEYQHESGREIGRLRKQGVQVTAEQDIPLICFLGDTTHQVFAWHPEVLKQHHVVVVECSFLDQDNIQNATTGKHMHWSDLKPIIESNPGTLFVLIHFSLRYKSLYLRQFFRDHQTQHRNIHPMLIEDEVQKEWDKLRRSSRPPDHTNAVANNSRKAPSCNCFRCQGPTS